LALLLALHTTIEAFANNESESERYILIFMPLSVGLEGIYTVGKLPAFTFTVPVSKEEKPKKLLAVTWNVYAAPTTSIGAGIVTELVAGE